MPKAITMIVGLDGQTFVIPAQAGIQPWKRLKRDPGVRRDGDGGHSLIQTKTGFDSQGGSCNRRMAIGSWLRSIGGPKTRLTEE